MTAISRPPWIVSIAFNWHDSSVAIAEGSNVRLVLEAERVFRVKRLRCSNVQMQELIGIALRTVGIEMRDVSIWCGTGFGNDLLSVPVRPTEAAVWTNVVINGSWVRMRLVNHHRAHAAMYFASPFCDAVVISCDGGGDAETHVIFRARNLTLDRLEKTEAVKSFSSTLYDRASFHLYGRYRQEGKFMGLAGWGQVLDGLKRDMAENVSAICNLSEEDGIALLERLYPIKQASKGCMELSDFAATVQAIFEDERVRSARDFASHSKNLVLTGGAALNIVANTKILEQSGYQSLYVAPCCDDTGQALGALLDTIALELNVRPNVNFPFLGRGIDVIPCDESEISCVVDKLIDGNVIAWHAGRSEIGPRALGHRSLLASPETAAMKVFVSEELKGRESYRPVAPLILQEYVQEWFDMVSGSPFMSFSGNSTAKCRAAAPAVVHVDGSARIQTLGSDGDPLLRRLLLQFYERTGVPILINTSLNGPELPICDQRPDTIEWLSTVDANVRCRVCLVADGQVCR